METQANMRWWVYIEDGRYGYCFAETKPLPFTWADVFITPPGTVRPVKTWAKITKIVNGN